MRMFFFIKGGEEMANYIVWGLFIFALCFLGFFFKKRVNENRAHRQKAAMEYEAKKER